VIRIYGIQVKQVTSSPMSTDYNPSQVRDLAQTSKFL